MNEQVRLQSAKSNQDQYDYYLVWRRPPETPPRERDAPEEGWRFQARGNEVGAVAQALLTSVGRQPTPILHYACRDLGVDKDAVRFWQGESLDQFQTVESADDHSWQPDGVFAVYDEAAWNDLREGDAGVEETETDDVSSWERMWLKREQQALRRVYPIEVKHDDASFGREQRAAMNELVEHDDDRVVPLLVRVRLDELPRHYSTRIHAGPFESD